MTRNTPVYDWRFESVNNIHEMPRKHICKSRNSDVKASELQEDLKMS